MQIDLKDLKYIKEVDSDLGDLTLNMIVASIDVFYDQVKEEEIGNFDLETINEIEQFLFQNLDILEEFKMNEEFVKAVYVIEALKLQKEKLKK